MVGDEDRGYLLELLLTKLRFAAGGGVKVALPPTPLLAGAPSTSNHTPGGTQTASDGTSQSSTPSQVMIERDGDILDLHKQPLTTF